MVHIKRLAMKGFKSFVKQTELPFTPGINCVLGPNGSGKSSSYETLVTLSTGEEVELGKIIEDQIRSSSIKKTLKDGIYVDGNDSIKILSLNKESMKLEEKVISKFIRRDGDPLYEITTRTGKKVRATGCHPVMVFREGKVQSTIIKKLKDGDLIATPRKIDIDGKEFDPQLARLLGYIIGDGYIAKDRIEFINKDQEIIEDFKDIIKSLFNVEIKERSQKNATRLYIRDKKFVKYIRSFFKKTNSSITSKDKKVPCELLVSNNLSLSNLLAGLYDTDGSVRKDISVLEFCTKNDALAKQVQGLLLRFGIISRIKKRLTCASNTKQKIKREYYYVYISGSNNLGRFYQNIPLKIEYKKQTIVNHLSKNSIPNQNLDLLPKEVNKDIKELTNLLGIKYKPVRKEYPQLAAYIENRCLPSREGLMKLINLFQSRINKLNFLFNTIQRDQICLIECMDQLNISGQYASTQIGLTKGVIRDHWATNAFNAKPENLDKFYYFIKGVFMERLPRIQLLLKTLFTLATSDIFWDRITRIEKQETPKYVYDLTVEGNHNFVANNIFVHNSNVSDALCFVLGRLSAKSMRAAKAKNLIFLGSKAAGPAKEASVEIVFDNQDKVFSMDSNEVSIRRIVRKNGQSIYKINEQTKTRQDVIALLAQAGIDPNGFNIILQGEIQNFVRMHTEERRKIIEEVAGISIYESRKQKSIKELDKTDEKLKEVIAVLRERTSYLNNLDKERQQALRFKKLEKDVKRYKASIIYADLTKKKKSSEGVIEEIEKQNKEIEKIKKLIISDQTVIDSIEQKISLINSNIQKSAGIEQEQLNTEIANLRAELAGMNVKIENHDSKLIQIQKQKQNLEESIRENDLSIKELQKENKSVKDLKKQQEVLAKKKELETLEEQRKKFYMVKTELKSVREILQDKVSTLQGYTTESNFILKEVESLTLELFDKKTDVTKLNEIKHLLTQKVTQLEELSRREVELEKVSHTNEYEISKQKEIIDKIAKLDICPLCKSQVTKEHIASIGSEINPIIDKLKKEIEDSDKELNAIYNNKELLRKDVEQIKQEIAKRESDIVKISHINSKKNQIKVLQERIDATKVEVEDLTKRKNTLERNFDENSNIEQRYETARIEVQEISLRSEENVDSEISFKKRELERAKINLKQLQRDELDLNEDSDLLRKQINQKERVLEKKAKQDEELSKNFKKLISERDSLQEKVRQNEGQLSAKRNSIHLIEQKINNFKIEKARYDAEVENLEVEMLEFPNVEIMKANRDSLTQKLSKAQETLSRIGSVNLRSLDVYDEIKKEYDSIKEKAEIIEKEKEGIMKIIHEIDIKKKRAFMSTFNQLNDIFSRNFAQISTKGTVSLDLENKKDPFEAGVGIMVKTGHGKYFDVTSLSGGEQTMVALSLIFAIQELNPYCFYVLDEIDAALDKRNSERLANLLKKYMQKGQYIVITHNDEIINSSTNIYGVSMHDGISKVISLKV